MLYVCVYKRHLILVACMTEQGSEEMEGLGEARTHDSAQSQQQGHSDQL